LLSRMGAEALSRLDPDDGCMYTFDGIVEKYASAYSPGEIAHYWSSLTSQLESDVPVDRCGKEYNMVKVIAALNPALRSDLDNDLCHFNLKFGTDLYLEGASLCNLEHLAGKPREELHRLLDFYAAGSCPLQDRTAQDMEVACDSGNGHSHSQPQARFQKGDRILCNVGIYWAAGKVLDVDAVDPEDPLGPRIPYVVKLDSQSGYKEPTAVPSDDDGVIRREICFDAYSELQFTKVAAPLLGVHRCREHMRFSTGVRVACRVADAAESVGVWQLGEIKHVWPELPPPHTMPYGRKTAEAVPYLVQLDSGHCVYAHRDDHTLIRHERFVPQKPTRGIARRFEMRQQPDGTLATFDHQTMRTQKVPHDSIECLDDDDNDDDVDC